VVQGITASEIKDPHGRLGEIRTLALRFETDLEDTPKPCKKTLRAPIQFLCLLGHRQEKNSIANRIT
jgi:hypothetical protein